MNDAEYKKMSIKILESIEDKQYKKYAAYRAILPHIERGKWFLKNMASINGKVLDLGGAAGNWGAYLQKMRSLRFNYTVLDYDQRHLDYGKKFFNELGLLQPIFIKHNVRQPLPFPDKSFSQVWFFGTSSILSKPIIPQVLEESWRVLQQNGHLFFDVPDRETKDWFIRYSKELNRIFSQFPVFSKEEIEDVLKSLMFKVVKMEKYLRQSPTLGFYIAHCVKGDR